MADPKLFKDMDTKIDDAKAQLVMAKSRAKYTKSINNVTYEHSLQAFEKNGTKLKKKTVDSGRITKAKTSEKITALNEVNKNLGVIETVKQEDKKRKEDQQQNEYQEQNENQQQYEDTLDFTGLSFLDYVE